MRKGETAVIHLQVIQRISEDAKYLRDLLDSLKTVQVICTEIDVVSKLLSGKYINVDRTSKTDV